MHRCPAARACLGRHHGLACRRPQLRDVPDHLRDDVARLVNDDRVADAHVLAAQLVVVVQRRARHNRAVHRGRIELGDGRERTGAPDLPGDVAQDGRLFLGRELERDAPARCLRREAQRFLQRELVDLHHHAVDVVVEAVAVLECLGAKIVHFLLAVDHADVGVDAEAADLEPLEKLGLPARGDLRLVCRRVDERGEIAVCGDARVLLAQRACGGVPAVGKRLLESALAPCALARLKLGVVLPDLVVFRLDRLVQAVEGRLGHVDLAADLDGARDAVRVALRAQAARDVFDLPDVDGHVLAHAAVAARRRADQDAVVVRERDRGTVDLELADVLQRAPDRLARAAQPLVELLEVHGVFDRVHAHGVLDRLEARGDGTADCLGRRRRGPKLWVAVLDGLELALERVVDGIGQLGRVLLVILVTGAFDDFAQLVDARANLVSRRVGPGLDVCRQRARENAGLPGACRRLPVAVHIEDGFLLSCCRHAITVCLVL